LTSWVRQYHADQASQGGDQSGTTRPTRGQTVRTSLIRPNRHRSPQSSRYDYLAVLAVKGSGVRIPSAPPSRSREYPGQDLDQSRESCVLYGRLWRPSHIQSLGRLGTALESNRAADQHLVCRRHPIRGSARVERGPDGRYLGIFGSGAKVSTPACPWENPSTRPQGCFRRTCGTRELDEFLGASSAGRPTHPDQAGGGPVERRARVVRQNRCLGYGKGRRHMRKRRRSQGTGRS
jgi:hypothetical protein